MGQDIFKSFPFLSFHTIEYVEHTKYLGITLDSKLNFNKHIEEKIKTAQKYFFALASSMGAIWGPAPEKILWIWNMVVKPAVCYGSLVWAPYLKQRHKDKLNKLQRLALLKIGHVRKSTPGAGLDLR